MTTAMQHNLRVSIKAWLCLLVCMTAGILSHHSAAEDSDGDGILSGDDRNPTTPKLPVYVHFEFSGGSLVAGNTGTRALGDTVYGCLSYNPDLNPNETNRYRRSTNGNGGASTSSSYDILELRAYTSSGYYIDIARNTTNGSTFFFRTDVPYPLISQLSYMPSPNPPSGFSDHRVEIEYIDSGIVTIGAALPDSLTAGGTGYPAQTSPEIRFRAGFHDSGGINDDTTFSYPTLVTWDESPTEMCTIGEDANSNGLLDALEPDTDGDGLIDSEEDTNFNGTVDPGETDPSVIDSDSDGLPDGLEVSLGLDPTQADSPGGVFDDENGDGVSNDLDEIKLFQRGASLFGTASEDNFGNQVSLSADGLTLAVGEAHTSKNGGSVSIYEWSGNGWSLKGTAITETLPGDTSNFGHTVSISANGDYVAVSDPIRGLVRVYAWSGSAWETIDSGNLTAHDISPSDATTNFAKGELKLVGSNLTGDGQTLAIAIGDQGVSGGTGKVYVYEWQNTGSGCGTTGTGTLTWCPLGPASESTDASFVSTVVDEQYGSAIDLVKGLSGNLFLAVGARKGDTTLGTDTGYAEIHEWKGTAWSQKGGKIEGWQEAINASQTGALANAVSLSSNGNRLSLGAPRWFDSGIDRKVGQVRVYDWNGEAWEQIGSTIEHPEMPTTAELLTHVWFGSVVQLSGDGNVLSVSVSEAESKGGAYLYTYDGSDWTKIGNSLLTTDFSASEGGTGRFGWSSSLSADGSKLAVGSPQADSSGLTNNGRAQVFQILAQETADSDADGVGDIADIDDDNDGISDLTDVYPLIANAASGFTDTDADDQPDECDTAFSAACPAGVTPDPDDDGDGVPDGLELLLNLNPLDANTAGGVVSTDINSDGVSDDADELIWFQRGSSLTGDNPGTASGAGLASSEDGNIIAIGEPEFDDPGAGSSLDNRGRVRIIQWDGDSWIQMGNAIVGLLPADGFGASVSISNDGLTLAVGSTFGDIDGGASNTGDVKIYQWNPGTSQWEQLGGDIDGETGNDQTGAVVSLSGDGLRVAVGDGYYDVTTSNSDEGRVRVFDYNSTANAWEAVGSPILGEAVNDHLGFKALHLSDDGNTIAIGAHEHDGAPDDPSLDEDRGQTRIYRLEDIGTGSCATPTSDNITFEWCQIGQEIEGESVSDELGSSVALSADGTSLAIGVPKDDVIAGTDLGQVRVYDYIQESDLWAQRGPGIDGKAFSPEGFTAYWFGKKVTISDNGSVVNAAASTPKPYGRSFAWDGLNWSELGEAITTSGGSSNDLQGLAASGDGTLVAISAPADASITGLVKIFKLNAQETADSDADGVGDNADTDDDNDGIADTTDAFPLDPAASIDTDLDGKPDDWNPGQSGGDSTSSPPLVLDTDDDNDGTSDSVDVFPLDPAAAIDTDGDGLPDDWNLGKTEADSTSVPALVLDLDDDNDGLTDAEEIALQGTYPSLSTTNPNSDTDDLTDGEEIQFGTNPTQPDTDSDGLDDHSELFIFGSDPTNPDSDGDGFNDGADIAPWDASVSTTLTAPTLPSTLVVTAPAPLAIDNPTLKFRGNTGFTYRFESGTSGVLVDKSKADSFTWVQPGDPGDVVQIAFNGYSDSLTLSIYDLSNPLTPQDIAAYIAEFGTDQVDVSVFRDTTNLYYVGQDSGANYYFVEQTVVELSFDDSAVEALLNLGSEPLIFELKRSLVQLTDLASLTKLPIRDASGLPFGGNQVLPLRFDADSALSWPERPDDLVQDTAIFNAPGTSGSGSLLDQQSSFTWEIIVDSGTSAETLEVTQTGVNLSWSNCLTIYSTTTSSPLIRLEKYDSYNSNSQSLVYVTVEDGNGNVCRNFMAYTTEDHYLAGTAPGIDINADLLTVLNKPLVDSIALLDDASYDSNSLFLPTQAGGIQIFEDGTAISFWPDPNAPQPDFSNFDPNQSWLQKELYFWTRSGATIALEARSLDDGNGNITAFANCDPASDPGCSVLETVNLRLLDIDIPNNRVYALVQGASDEPASIFEFFEYLPQDQDVDGQPDLDELLADLNPFAFNDGDSDGVSDFRETTILGTDPSLPDTDGDGVNDDQDLVPTSPDWQTLLPFTSPADVPSELMAFFPGALSNPTLMTITGGNGQTLRFNSNFTGIKLSTTGSTPFTWSLDPDGRIVIDFLNDASDGSLSFIFLSNLSTLVTQAGIDNFSATFPTETQVETQVTTTRLVLTKLSDTSPDSCDNCTYYWIQAVSTYTIVDPARRAALLGSEDAGPVSLPISAGASRNYVLLQNEPILPIIAGNGLPYGGSQALIADYDPAGGVGRQLIADTMVFDANGTGSLFDRDHTFNWTTDAEGRLIVTPTSGPAVGTTLRYQKYEAYPTGQSLFYLTIDAGTEEFALMHYAVPDRFLGTATVEVFSQLLDKPLLSSYDFTDPSDYDDLSGNIFTLSEFFGYRLNSDGTADRSFNAEPSSLYTDTWHWRFANGTIYVEARWLVDGNGTVTEYYSSCDPATNSLCQTARSRSWRVLDVSTDGRLYVVETEAPLLFGVDIKPRVQFYKALTQDRDGDNISDVTEVLSGTDPYNANDFDADSFTLTDTYPLDANYGGDSDLDGIDDVYESNYSLGVPDPTADNDGDGLDVRAEYAGGTLDTVPNEAQIITGTTPLLRPLVASKIRFSYDVSDQQAGLSGLGLRIHFHEKDFNLFNIEVNSPYDVGLFEINNVWTLDDKNLDGDFSTNRYVSIEWDDQDGPWPGTALPLEAFSVIASPKPFFDPSEVAVVNFSAFFLGSGYGLSAPRLNLRKRLAPMMDVDADGTVSPLTDGLIILRWLFGFQNITGGSISNNSPFASDPGGLINMLESQEEIFDIDGDGATEPLTDGILFLRYLFGFRGEGLVNGAMGANSSRNTATMIEDHLDQMSDE